VTVGLAVALAALSASTASWQARAVIRETSSPARLPEGVASYAALTALATLVLAVRLPAGAGLAAVLLTIGGVPLAIIDARTHRLPDSLTGLTSVAVAAALIATAVVTHSATRLSAAAVGAAAMAGFYALLLVASATLGSAAAYGIGDVKLALSVGAVLGSLGPLPWFAGLLGAHLLYLAVHASRAAGGHSGWRTRHAFGPPMLTAAALAAVLLG